MGITAHSICTWLTKRDFWHWHFLHSCKLGGKGPLHTMMGVGGHSLPVYLSLGPIYWSRWPRDLSAFNVALVTWGPAPFLWTDPSKFYWSSSKITLWGLRPSHKNVYPEPWNDDLKIVDDLALNCVGTCVDSVTSFCDVLVITNIVASLYWSKYSLICSSLQPERIVFPRWSPPLHDRGCCPWQIHETSVYLCALCVERMLRQRC